MAFHQVADRVWVGRHGQHDVTSTAIAGDRGLLLVDTPAGAQAAAGLIADLDQLGAGDVVAVALTHAHRSHPHGMASIRARYPALAAYAHEAAAELAGADHSFSSATSLDLGGRLIELVHPGRGHSDGDLVVRVPDADVLVVGDLVVGDLGENTDPPRMGEDCFPLEWPWTLDIVLGLSTSSTVLVPGHGTVTDRAWVEQQRNAIGLVAQEIRDLAGRGVPAQHAVAAGTWPYPEDTIVHAVRRGYQQLARHERRLPLT